MSRKAGSKSTIEISVSDLFDKLTPYKGTPLKIQVGTAWANSLKALGIDLGGATPDDETEEDDETETVTERPKFQVEEAGA